MRLNKLNTFVEVRLDMMKSTATPTELSSTEKSCIKICGRFVDKGDVNNWMANLALADVLKRGSFEIF
jgi:hypothetical protein